MRWIFSLAVLAACDETDPSSATDGSEPTEPDSDPEPLPTESSPTTEDTDTTPSTPTEPVDDSVQQKCVDVINEYRATLSLPPYARWTEVESCVDGQAQTDSETGIAHSAFGVCGEWAQNECPGWGGSYSDVIDGCFAMMWAEGPGEPFSEHGHFINMSSTSYTKVACGFYTTPGGEIWEVQDFQ